MKLKIIGLVVISATLMACQQKADSDKNFKLETDQQKVSYGMGVGLGDRIANESFTVDIDAFSRGMKDAIAGGDRLMTQEEIMQAMQKFQKEQLAAQEKAMEETAKKNKEEGEAFLAENATKEGVVTTDSGLQYKVITEGSGEKPKETDTVEVHYKGRLIDGTEFDSSYKRNSTVTFPVNGVIPGWTEALQLMPVGSKWELYIPSGLAYGPGGTGGGPIGPNATLIFEVELVNIVKDSE